MVRVYYLIHTTAYIYNDIETLRYQGVTMSVEVNVKQLRGFIVFLVFLFLTVFTLYANRTGGIELPELQKPNAINLDDSQLYITDGMSVLIYSLKDFKFIKKFGKKGEGPREFMDSPYGLNITLYPDYMVVHSLGRESFFKKDGSFIREQNTNPLSIGLKPLGNGYVGQKLITDREKKSIEFGIVLYNDKFETVKDLHRFPHPFFLKQKINPFDLKGSTFQVYNEKVFINDQEGHIMVFDEKGDKLKTIALNIPKVEATKELRERFLNHWQYSVLSLEYKRFKDNINFSADCPAIRDFRVVDGKMYVTTYKEVNGQNRMIIVTTDGKPVKKTFVPMVHVNMVIPVLYSFYTIHHDKLYRLEENPDTESWELFVSGI